MGTVEKAKSVADTGVGETAIEGDVDSVAEEETCMSSTAESSTQKWQEGVVETCVVVGDDVLEGGSREQGS